MLNPSDPNLSAAELRQLATRYPEEVLRNPAVPLLLMEDPGFAVVVYKCWGAVAGSKLDELSRGTSDREAEAFLRWCHGRAHELLSERKLREFSDYMRKAEYLPPGQEVENGAELLSRIAAKEQGDTRTVPFAQTRARLLIECCDELALARGKKIDWPKIDMKPNRRRRR
jgi:hypothetical protein